MNSPGLIEILEPTAPGTATTNSAAPHLNSLKGKAVGIRTSGGEFDKFVSCIEEYLQEYEPREVVMMRVGMGAGVQNAERRYTVNTPEEWDFYNKSMEKFASQIDWAIVGVGV